MAGCGSGWLMMGFFVALASSLVLSKTLDSEVFFYCKEDVEFLLGHTDLPMLHEVEHRLEVSVGEGCTVEYF